MQSDDKQAERKLYVLLAGTVAFFLALTVSEHTYSQQAVLQAPRVRIQQVACGALLRDDFDGPKIDSSFWRATSADPGIKVEIADGELCLCGTSAPLSIDGLPKNPEALYRYAGLYSRPFAQVDAALAVRVKMVSGISSEPGNHVVNVHLCGVHPDSYSEVMFGKVEAKVMEKTLRDYLGWEQRYQDARGWWFNIVDQKPGGYAWRVSGSCLAEQGDEKERFYEVLVDYDERAHVSRGFLKLAKGWVQLGKAEPVIRGLSVIELKITNVTPLAGAYREARFDDCRFYPNPRHNPVRFVVTKGGQPYRGAPLKVALYTPDGQQNLGEGSTNEEGIAYLPLEALAEEAFPVSARIRIFRKEKEIGWSAIEAHGIEGLYPSDVWVYDSTQIE